MGDIVHKRRLAGRECLVIDFRYVGKDGQPERYRRAATIQTWTAARSEAKRLQALASEHGEIVRERGEAESFRSFVEGTFEQVYMPEFRSATQVRYRALLRQGILDAFGAKPLDGIEPMHLRVYGTALIKRGVQPRGHLNLLRAVFRCAVDSGALAKAPEVPVMGKRSKKLPDAPSLDEVRATLEHARGWIHTAVALAAFAGLRQGEVRAIEAQDVDLELGAIVVRRALSENEVTTPKSGHERIVPIADALRPMLVDAVKGKKSSERLVLTEDGTTPKRQHVYNALRSLQNRRELRHRSFHSLRHFFCSQLCRIGSNVEAVRALAGHSSIAVTQRYVHATAAEHRATMASFSDELGNTRETTPGPVSK